jgi:hypothetical protein
MPVSDVDEQKDDYELLRALLNRHMKLEDKIPDISVDATKVMERFIS